MAEALVYVDGKPHLVTTNTKEYFLLVDSGNVHRPSNEGPAVCMSDGSEYYYEHGKKHRLDGPAISNSLGYKCWYVNGKLHNLDGPAKIWPDGNEEYWIDGKAYDKNEWIKEREKWLKR